MRTTLTLDDDLAEALKEQARRTDQPFEQVVNDTLRRGLSPARAETGRRYRVRPHPSGFRTGVDPMRLNQPGDSPEVGGFPLQQTGASTDISAIFGIGDSVDSDIAVNRKEATAEAIAARAARR